jgi:hypothetical protein
LSQPDNPGENIDGLTALTIKNSTMNRKPKAKYARKDKTYASRDKKVAVTNSADNMPSLRHHRPRPN